MANKNNIRSIRFSDELAELIDRQVGRTFTEKFENLVTRCVWELPKKDMELAQIRAQISKEQQRLRELEKKRLDLQLVPFRFGHVVLFFRHSLAPFPRVEVLT